jgi:hypothetical protein
MQQCTFVCRKDFDVLDEWCIALKTLDKLDRKSLRLEALLYQSSKVSIQHSPRRSRNAHNAAMIFNLEH